MPNLFLTGEELAASPPIVAYRVLALIDGKEGGKISIFDIVDALKKEKWFSFNHVTLALIFLYTSGLIDFNAPYVTKNVED
jgi:hypothetical protein